MDQTDYEIDSADVDWPSTTVEIIRHAICQPVSHGQCGHGEHGEDAERVYTALRSAGLLQSGSRGADGRSVADPIDCEACTCHPDRPGCVPR